MDAAHIRAAEALAEAHRETAAGRVLVAAELLVTEAELAAAAAPARAAELLFAAVGSYLAAGEVSDAGVAARRALDLAEDPFARALARLGIAQVHLVSGNAARAARETTEALDGLPSDPRADEALRYAIVNFFWLEQYATAASLLERQIDAARRARRVTQLPLLLDTLAAVDYRLGHWPRAEARSTEALRLAREHGLRFETGSCLTTLARLAAARGDDQLCRTLLAEADAYAAESQLIVAYSRSTAGLLELGFDRPAPALAHLEGLRDLRLAATEPAVLLWEADLVEAYVRTRRLDEARSALAELERRAPAAPHAWASAAAARCRVLLAATADIEHASTRAVELAERAHLPFELGRTHLVVGQRLRRARRTALARQHLQTAEQIFEQLGAEPWRLRASRERVARVNTTAARLTPHELEVARRVATGASNREVAEALFVSVKTVEYHLASIYRKLNVRSRTELAHGWRDGGT